LQFYTPKGYSTAAKTGTKHPAVVNFHGGGFTIGNGTDDARFARFVLEECNAVFVSVDYRLSPEYPFPVAVEDAADALLYLIRSGPDHHIDPLKLATSGFSAGANLAITSTLRLTDHLATLRQQPNAHIPPHRIRAIATWYPVTDYTQSRAAKRAASIRPDQTLPETLTNLFDAAYLQPPTLALANPYLSPTRATDAQLAAAIPETVIFYTCEYDMLMREGEALAARLGRAPIGKDVRYKMVEGVPHAWDKSPDPTKPAAWSEGLYRECCGILREVFERA
jgi:acetyl esterase/lipase